MKSSFLLSFAGLLAIAAPVSAQGQHRPTRFDVFRSHDRARSWVPSGAGLPSSARINAFGAVGSAVLAGTDQGVYLSLNRGANWMPGGGAATGSGRVLSLATLGAIAYAGTDRSGLLVSVDGGHRWTLKADAPFRYVRSLVAHDGLIYAGTDSQGVFVSRDRGESWSSIGAGLPVGAQIFTMAQVNGTVFAGLYSKGLYVWREFERRWQKLDGVAPLALAATKTTLLAGHNPGGVHRSDDLGVSWIPVVLPASPDLGNAPVWELGSNSDLAIAGVAAGLYYSEDRGRNWARALNGLPASSAGIAFFGGTDFVLAAISVQEK